MDSVVVKKVGRLYAKGTVNGERRYFPVLLLEGRCQVRTELAFRKASDAIVAVGVLQAELKNGEDTAATVQEASGDE